MAALLLRTKQAGFSKTGSSVDKAKDSGWARSVPFHDLDTKLSKLLVVALSKQG
jgi:hypothetical protein